MLSGQLARCLIHTEYLVYHIQAAVKRRDSEIQRLAIRAEKGPDANQMNLRFKNETNESIILQLNSQVSHGFTQHARTVPACDCGSIIAYW